MYLYITEEGIHIYIGIILNFATQNKKYDFSSFPVLILKVLRETLDTYQELP